MCGSSSSRHTSGMACTFGTILTLLLAFPLSCHPETAFIPQGNGLKHHSPTVPSHLQLCLIAARPGALPVAFSRVQPSPRQHPGWLTPRCPRSSPALRAAGDGEQGAGDASEAAERSEATNRESSVSESSEDELLFVQNSFSSEGSQESLEDGTVTVTGAAAEGGSAAGSEKGKGGQGMRVRSSILLRPFEWLVRALSWVLNKVTCAACPLARPGRAW